MSLSEGAGSRGSVIAYGAETQSGQFTSLSLSSPGMLMDISPFAEQSFAGDFADDGAMYVINDQTGDLERIEINGVRSIIGPVVPGAGELWSGLAFDHRTGVMYATATVCGTSSTLYTLDLASGEATAVGEITNSPCMIALAIGDGDAYGYDVITDELLRVNLATGAGTVIGPIGFDANFGQGMDYDESSGTFYMSAFNNASFTGELRTVDTTTGATTLVGQIGSGGTTQLGWLAIRNPVMTPAYGTETQSEKFVRFRLDSPEALDSVAPFEDFAFAGDFADDGFMYVANADTGNLERVGRDGARTVVGAMDPVSGQDWTGMAFDDSSGVMYATASVCGTNSTLYTVDLSSGAVSVVGDLVGVECLIAIAINDAGEAYGHDVISDELYSIDLATGETRTIGPIGFDANFGQGMDYDRASGQFYMSAFNSATFTGELRVVNTETGATSFVGTLGSGGTTQVGWLALDNPELIRAYGTETQTLRFTSLGLGNPGSLLDIGAFTDLAFAGDFADDGAMYVINNPTGNLERLETDGTRTVIGPITALDGELWTGMAFDHGAGLMYATSTQCGVRSTLYSVNLATGGTLVIGEVTNSVCIIAIAIGDSGDAYGYDINTDQLVRVDLATGAGTVIGPIGFDASFAQGMDYDEASGTFYMSAFNNSTFTGELRTVDTSTGATTLIGQIGSGGTTQIGWLAIEPQPETCPADLAMPFGVLDFDDVLAFLVAFGAMDAAADLAEPFGQFDFDDILAFLVSFGSGCP